MGLDLYHSTPVKISEGIHAQKQNISDFPEHCKEKLKEFIFYEDVVYIDWEATFQKLFQMTVDQFYDQFEMFMESSDGKYHFCVKDCENPWNDEGSFVVVDTQCEVLTQSDPHIFVKSLGGQRGGMKSSFFTAFDANEIVCDLGRVKEMSKHTDSPETFEVFIENFINTWTPNSFVEVSY